MTLSSSLPLLSPACDGRAFTEAVASFAPDLPLLMFGSGDVDPSEVNADTVAILAELTVQYISELVEAAVDAHDLLTDGAGGVLPPPALPHKRLPPRPPSPTIESKSTAKGTTTTAETQRKRRRADEEYWDDPLPEPKVRKQPKPASSSSQSSTVAAAAESDPATSSSVRVDEWVGVSGVDFWENTRSRRVHVATPSAIGTQCFIFPICHDAGLYGRVMEVQAARRTIAPVLVDHVWMELVRTEGNRRGPSSSRIRDVATEDVDNTGEVDEDEDENQDVEHRATWPGLESLLPIHRSDNV